MAERQEARNMIRRKVKFISPGDIILYDIYITDLSKLDNLMFIYHVNEIKITKSSYLPSEDVFTLSYFTGNDNLMSGRNYNENDLVWLLEDSDIKKLKDNELFSNSLIKLSNIVLNNIIQKDLELKEKEYKAMSDNIFIL